MADPGEHRLFVVWSGVFVEPSDGVPVAGTTELHGAFPGEAEANLARAASAAAAEARAGEGGATGSWRVLVSECHRKPPDGFAAPGGVLHFLWGGVFENTRFEALEAGAEELRGPFADMASADRAWSEGTRRNIDVASHRLFVLTAARQGRTA